MGKIIKTLVAAFLISVLVFPIDVFSRGGGHGGRGGHYSGGKGGGGKSHISGVKSGKSKSRQSKSKSSSFKSRSSSKKKDLSSRPASSKKSRKVEQHKKSNFAKKSVVIHNRRKSSLRYSSPIKYDQSVRRDSKGRIERSESAKHAFLKNHGYKRVPSGYEVDHIIPLYAGGRDSPSNMQLLTKAQHNAKTRADYERYGR
jgi:5-methylcytosine-specific restriction endonuclease McrA